MSTKKSEFGVFGLGVMGSSISLKIAAKGVALSLYNRSEGAEENVVNTFMKTNVHMKQLQGIKDLMTLIE